MMNENGKNVSYKDLKTDVNYRPPGLFTFFACLFNRTEMQRNIAYTREREKFLNDTNKYLLQGLKLNQNNNGY